MRRGGKRIDWTVDDLRYLLANAGKLPKRDICEHLRRSAKSVERKAAWLRKQGHKINLRYYETTLEPCPACGHQSATIDRHGLCEPCRRREQLATIHARIADLLAQLPAEERDIYERTEAETESSLVPRPLAPNTKGFSDYRKARAEERHAIAVERWKTANLLREIKAAQKRKERIEKKVKSMGVSSKPQVRRSK